MHNAGTGGQMVTPPDETTADPYAVIAALSQQLAERSTERAAALAEKAKLAKALAERSSEYAERIKPRGAPLDIEALGTENEELRAAQAAGLEVLRAMVGSPGNTQPIFDLIARQAAKLCQAPIAAVATFDGAMVHLVTQSGFDPAYADVFAKQFPRSLSPDFAMGRAILNRRVEQIEDTGADSVQSGFPARTIAGPSSAAAFRFPGGRL
jgi:hypothetical protein